jgi:hypothetical protein
LRQAILGTDAVAARYGGEEFAVILPAVQATNEQRLTTAKDLAGQIREAIETATLVNNGETLGVRVSLGLTAAIASVTSEQLVARADEALCAAKNAGRNRCYYHSGKACLPVEEPAAASAEQKTPTPQPVAGLQAAVDKTPAPQLPAALPQPALSQPVLLQPAPVELAPFQSAATQPAPPQPTPVLEKALPTEPPAKAPLESIAPAAQEPVAQATISPSEPAKKQSGRDRRKHDRVRCNGVHLVAPCLDDRIPPIDKFFRVQFFDISSGGFAMILPSAPASDRFAVALKKSAGLVFMGAEVMNVRVSEEIMENGKPMTIVGCKFTQRLTNPTASVKPEHVST